MRRNVAAVVAVAGIVALGQPSVAAPAPQVVDPANDANGGAHGGASDTPTPVGSQPYADVVSVQFATTKAMGKAGGRNVLVVTGFTVAMRLTEPPVPPAGTVAVYRVLASGPRCLFAVDHYTRPPAGQPQSAVQEWCGPSIRRKALAAPRITGSTITWIVPLSALPKNTGAGVGSTLTDLHFDVLVRVHDSACASDAGRPGEEVPPCAVTLDETLRRSGTYTIR